ncbi:MAG: hypothetical protein ACO3DQ_06565 [Cephaloticoccus sp.]
MPHPALSALRSLVDTRFPASARKTAAGLATGIAALDAALDGGLPPGRLTELVCPPGAGAQSVLAQLLAVTRAASRRVALVDAADGFAPEAIPPDDLRHLVWARARSLTEALGAADVLVRDGNYALVILDLRDVPARALNRTPASTWHRLHRVAEAQSAAVAVFSRHGLVPAVPRRVQLARTANWTAPRADWLRTLHVETLRGRPQLEALSA